MNFTRSWETKVVVNNEVFLDLAKMADQEQKAEVLETLGSFSRAAQPDQPYDPEAVQDDGLKDTFVAYSLYFSPDEKRFSLKSLAKLGVNSLTINGESVDLATGLAPYDLTLIQVPYFLRLADDRQQTFFSKDMLIRPSSKPTLLLWTANLFYPYSVFDNHGDDLQRVSGQASLSGLQLDANSPETAQFEFVIKQDAQPFVETSFSVTTPLVAFNNIMTVSFSAQALVNTAPGTTIDSLPPSSSFAEYPMVARVYLRSKDYPYDPISMAPHPRAVLDNTKRDYLFNFVLEPQIVQTDLAGKVELVFDFSDMVQLTFDTDSANKIKQLRQGEWVDSRIKVSDVSVLARCKEPLKLSEIEIYQNTVSALRKQELLTEYFRVTTYRVDLESEGRVTSLNIAIPLVVVVFLIAILGCCWKIHQYHRSMGATKIQMEQLRIEIGQHREEATRLRGLKLQRRRRVEEQQRERAEPLDLDFQALDSLVGGAEPGLGAALERDFPEQRLEQLDPLEEEKEEAKEPGLEADKDHSHFPNY